MEESSKSHINYLENLVISRICEPRTLQEVAKIKSSFEYSLTYGGKELVVISRKHEVVNNRQN